MMCKPTIEYRIDAVLHICGLGFYEASLDGKRIGRKVLDPAPTDYDDRVLYSTYEIADLFAAPGEHSLEVLLGRGAYDIHVPEVVRRTYRVKAKDHEKH